MSEEEEKLESKICILNEDISSEIKYKIENGSIDFEKDITRDNLFVEVVFQEKYSKDEDKKLSIVVDLLTSGISNEEKNKYLNRLKKDFTIVQTQFFLIEENSNPYLITRSDNHVVTKGISILFPVKVHIDEVQDTIERAITNKIDKLIYYDDNESYFLFGFLSNFRHNRLKYYITSYGKGYNSVADNRANYLFFVYSVYIKNENLSNSKRNYFLYDKDNINIDIPDSFKMPGEDFKKDFKKWYKSLSEQKKVVCKYCVQGMFDTALIASIVYEKKYERFKNAYIYKEYDKIPLVYESKYENLLRRIFIISSRSAKKRILSKILKFPEKILYGILLSYTSLIIAESIDGLLYKIIIFILSLLILVPISEAIIKIVVNLMSSMEESMFKKNEER